jgi:uncharacterized BrkB/YihY/UPF0761 family membrane protein
MEKSQKLSKVYLSTTKGAVHTLLILFVLGMIANLYIEIPEKLVNAEAWKYVFTSAPIIAIHAVLGMLLLVVSIASLVMAFLNHRTSWIVASVLGLIFTGLAAFSGSDFVSNGQSNLSSLLMAFGFLGAIISYSLAVFQSRTK